MKKIENLMAYSAQPLFDTVILYSEKGEFPRYHAIEDHLKTLRKESQILNCLEYRPTLHTELSVVMKKHGIKEMYYSVRDNILYMYRLNTIGIAEIPQIDDWDLEKRIYLFLKSVDAYPIIEKYLVCLKHDTLVGQAKRKNVLQTNIDLMKRGYAYAY